MPSLGAEGGNLSLAPQQHLLASPCNLAMPDSLHTLEYTEPFYPVPFLLLCCHPPPLSVPCHTSLRRLPVLPPH